MCDLNLKLKIIHPEAMKIIMGIHPDLSKLITTKENKLYTLTSDGMITEAENGENGVFYFVKIYKDINWKKMAPKRLDKVNFILKNITDKIIIPTTIWKPCKPVIK